MTRVSVSMEIAMSVWAVVKDPSRGTSHKAAKDGTVLIVIRLLSSDPPKLPRSPPRPCPTVLRRRETAWRQTGSVQGPPLSDREARRCSWTSNSLMRWLMAAGAEAKPLGGAIHVGFGPDHDDEGVK